MHTFIRRPRMAAALGALAICLAAIWVAVATSNTSAASKAKTSQSLTKIELIATQNAVAGVLEIGKKKGFFRKAGIDLSLNYRIPPANTNAALLAGSAQMAQYNWGLQMSLVANGVPLKAVGQISTAVSKNCAKDDTQLAVLASSSIKSYKDIGGKKIGIIAPNGAVELSLRTKAAQLGVSQDQMKFATVPLPAMPGALRSGQVDAAMFIEPWVQIAKRQGLKLRLLNVSICSMMRGAPSANVITTERFKKSNPKAVANFRKALNQSTAYVAKNPNQLRAILPGILQQPKSVTSKANLPVFTSKIDRKKLQRFADIYYRYKKTRRKVNVNELF